MYNINDIIGGEASQRLPETFSMCTFIKMEYLVANALVELYEKKGIDKISLDDIRNYGIKVEEEMNSQENTRAILLYSNVYTKEFLQDYSDWFELIDNYIKIKDGVTTLGHTVFFICSRYQKTYNGFPCSDNSSIRSRSNNIRGM